jgi:hypothetical protein
MFYCKYRLLSNNTQQTEGREGAGDKNGSKQHEMHRLGLRYVFFICSHIVFMLMSVIYVLNYGTCDLMGRDNENGPERCKTRSLGHKYVLLRNIAFSCTN